MIVLQREVCRFWVRSTRRNWLDQFVSQPRCQGRGPPSNHRSSTLMPIYHLKKVRRYLLILWCCSKYKAFFQCWVGSAASEVRHLPGNWCRPESHWAPWTTVLMSRPRVLGHLCSRLSCPLLLLLWDRHSPWLLFLHYAVVFAKT